MGYTSTESDVDIQTTRGHLHNARTSFLHVCVDTLISFLQSISYAPRQPTL